MLPRIFRELVVQVRCRVKRRAGTNSDIQHIEDLREPTIPFQQINESVAFRDIGLVVNRFITPTENERQSVRESRAGFISAEFSVAGENML